MSNFDFLINEFEILKESSQKAESSIQNDPEISLIYSRKSLEASLKLLFKFENLDFDKNLSDMLRDEDFVDILPSEILNELHYIRKIGNIAVHDNRNLFAKDALYSNKCLYKFQRWIVECYSSYSVVDYDVLKIVDEKQSKEEALAKENEKLLIEIEKLKSKIAIHDKKHIPKVEGIDEATTRRELIDLELKSVGYSDFKKGLDIEYKLNLENSKFGFADYVIWDDEMPLAVIEAKSYSKSVNIAKTQVELYKQALEKQFNTKVLAFVTNGKEWEYSDGFYPFAPIHSFFPKDELKREIAKSRDNIEIDRVKEELNLKYYQKLAIEFVANRFNERYKKALLVMATGTGKTRTSIAIADMLIKAGWVRRVLFLADRIELVKQAKNSFSEFLNESSVNLLQEKDLSNRLQFGTYETVHNLINSGAYNSAYFDLIIIDEAHRSIYKKYRAMFEYFNALFVGLTATPRDEIDRNTFEFFGNDNYSYNLKEAIGDGNLVDFRAIEMDLGIVIDGISYKNLSESEKEEFEEKFEEDIKARDINDKIFNRETNEIVLRELHSKGLKIESGNRIGKTIIFAKNQKHAEYIKKIFDELYPARTKEAEIIHSEISHYGTLIEKFKSPNKNPFIAISVDMLDTGIDVPQILNLVFFKPIKSKVKFWQMIGRGTRLCKNLIDGEDKQEFYIFDFCSNFSFFDIKPEGEIAKSGLALRERLFIKRFQLIKESSSEKIKSSLKEIIKNQINEINLNSYEVKKDKSLIEKVVREDVENISLNDIKKVAKYISDKTSIETQRFNMLIVDIQMGLKDKREVKSFAQKLKSKEANISAISQKSETLNLILSDKFDLEELEEIRKEIEDLAKLVNSDESEIVYTNFKDEIKESREIDTSKHIENLEIINEIEAKLYREIDKLHIIEEIKVNESINDSHIESLKHFMYRAKELIEDSGDFERVIKSIIKSTNKYIANSLFEEYIKSRDLTKRQLILMNKIKNIVFEKSFDRVKEDLSSDLTEIGKEFEKEEEEFQYDIGTFITTMENIDLTISKKLNINY